MREFAIVLVYFLVRSSPAFGDAVDEQIRNNFDVWRARTLVDLMLIAEGESDVAEQLYAECRRQWQRFLRVQLEQLAGEARDLQANIFLGPHSCAAAINQPEFEEFWSVASDNCTQILTHDFPTSLRAIRRENRAYTRAVRLLDAIAKNQVAVVKGVRACVDRNAANEQQLLLEAQGVGDSLTVLKLRVGGCDAPLLQRIKSSVIALRRAVVDVVAEESFAQAVGDLHEAMRHIRRRIREYSTQFDYCYAHANTQ